MKSNLISTLPPLRHGEFLQCMKNVVTIYDKNDVKALAIEKPFFELQNQTAEMERVFQRPAAHELTPVLNLHDELRTGSMKSCYKMIQSYVLRDNPLQKPAELLEANYLLHGGKIDRLTQPQKTASINAMITDWNENPSLADAVEKLKLQDIIAELVGHNNLFDEKYIERVRTTQETGQINQKRKLIRNAFNNLITVTEARLVLGENEAAYQTILRDVNALILRFKSMVSLRVSGGKKPKAPESPNTPTTPETPEDIWPSM
ncbi:MAG: hypothetical protein IPL63_02465 [Saprospiraceae bacterium]|nr:hypothetical protein [Saprospiraceae bacterium]MBK6785406.1 hypothetical protein [Saprospiraceae bacterium]MBK8546275.1 hypothetical protein [Saprospiraceae bacterium]